MVGTRGSNAQAASNSSKTSPASDKQSQRSNDDAKSTATDTKDAAPAGQPLGPPPPRPAQANGERGDYFSGGHQYTSEPNPFEAQFANPSDTPGKLLPPVAALTSPQSLLPGDTPGWNSSLRSGPLSPAMLAGPASTDYFDQGLRGFPTPNESSLRTGLTPGGGGSMFPAASPGTQAIFSLSNINTPGALEFMRSARAATNGNGNGPTSQPSDNQTSQSMDLRLPNQTSGGILETSGHDADAASSLFLLAQNGTRGNNFTASNAASSVASNPATVASAGQTAPKTRGKKNSIASMGSISTQDDDDSDTDMSEEAVKPTTRSRGRKATADSRQNNRRKATDTPAKTPASKRARGNASLDKMDSSPTLDSAGKESKKGMTEEDKRKNFLERNRVAALKCRQRKKQWLQNLQQKVDLYGQENEALTNHVNQLREQIFQLRGLIVQHRDCPSLANHPTLMNIMSQDMSGQFMQTGNGAVQQIPMMLQDTRQIANGGPVMPRN